MHTTRIETSEGEAVVIHNADWSGEVEVRWASPRPGGGPTAGTVTLPGFVLLGVGKQAAGMGLLPLLGEAVDRWAAVGASPAPSPAAGASETSGPVCRHFKGPGRCDVTSCPNWSGARLLKRVSEPRPMGATPAEPGVPPSPSQPRTLVRSPGGTGEKVVALDEVEVPDCWHAAEFLTGERRDGFADNVRETWALAHDLLKALRALTLSEEAKAERASGVRVPKRVYDGLVNVIRQVARPNDVTVRDAESLVSGAFAGMGVEVES